MKDAIIKFKIPKEVKKEFLEAVKVMNTTATDILSKKVNKIINKRKSVETWAR